ncbi:YqgE/AlgH family protein [Paraflavitalea speifideaquila]|uniref:YqgE/AlgH family protein n=1 Tax=Paraflavitalea speifideaquila TaxID=3076558 RepID=UPI0028E72A4B|nr:YqgE/AlgH family protein [Paraflavitalea speifideiaquila]
MKDPNFMRTVVFLCDHQEEGSFGFVLNRAYEHTLNELMNDLDELKLPVFTAVPFRWIPSTSCTNTPPSFPVASRYWTIFTGRRL